MGAIPDGRRRRPDGVALQTREPGYLENKLGPGSAVRHFASLVLHRVRNTNASGALIDGFNGILVGGVAQFSGPISNACTIAGSSFHDLPSYPAATADHGYLLACQ